MTEQNRRQINVSFPAGGLAIAATLTLFVLKSTVYPTVSWWLVFAPVIVVVGVPLAIFIAIGLFALGVLLIVPAMDRRHQKQMLRRRNMMYRGKKP